MLKDILRLEQLGDFATDKTCHQFYYANAELLTFTELRVDSKNKTNHPISSNSHPSVTVNKAIHSLKIRGGGTKNKNIL